MIVTIRFPVGFPDEADVTFVPLPFPPPLALVVAAATEVLAASGVEISFPPPFPAALLVSTAATELVAWAMEVVFPLLPPPPRTFVVAFPPPFPPLPPFPVTVELENGATVADSKVLVVVPVELLVAVV